VSDRIFNFVSDWHLTLDHAYLYPFYATA